MNDIGDVNINMYVDDCILYCTGNNWERVRTTLQRSLTNITEWFKFNALKLIINIKKSKCLIISSKVKLRSVDRHNGLR